MESSESLIRVFTGSVTEAKILEGKLKQSGIPVMIKDNFESGITTSGASDDVEVYIDEKDLNSAEDIIADYKDKND